MEKALQYCFFIVVCLLLLLQIKALRVQEETREINKDTNQKISELQHNLEGIYIQGTIEE